MTTAVPLVAVNVLPRVASLGPNALSLGAFSQTRHITARLMACGHPDVPVEMHVRPSGISYLGCILAGRLGCVLIRRSVLTTSKGNEGVSLEFSRGNPHLFGKLEIYLHDPGVLVQSLARLRAPARRRRDPRGCVMHSAVEPSLSSEGHVSECASQ